MSFYTYGNGDQMPLLGLGTWKSVERGVYNAVREALRIGYRHFDCAARYENEKEIGEALADAFRVGDVHRTGLWVTSKLWNSAHLPQDVRPALLQTLRDLQLEYLDLYLMHWPVALKPGVLFPLRADEFLSLEEAPLIDTWYAMEQCKNEGLVRHLGTSNFSIPKIVDLQRKGGQKPECNQVECHPFFPQQELLQYCRENHIAFTAYSPLGSSDRPPRLRGEADPLLLEHPVLAQIAQEISSTPGQVLIAWALHRGTAVIPKSSNPIRLRQNFEASQVRLSEAQMEELDHLDRNFRYVNGSIWTIPGSPYTLNMLWNE